MDEPTRKSRSARLTTSLQLQLDALTQGRGVLSKELRHLLANELSDLRRFWELDLGDSLANLQKQVQKKLIEHFRRIPPYRNKASAEGDRREVFLRSFQLSFNIFLLPHEQLEKKNDRQRLIEELNRKGATFETAVRDLLFAYAEIEKQILETGFEPKVPVSVFRDDSPTETESEADSPGAGKPIASNASAPRIRHRKLLVIALSVVGALVAAGAVIPMFISSADDPPTYLTVQQSPLDIRTTQSTSPNLVIPQPLSQISRPPGAEGAAFDAWKAQYHAVYADTMHITFIARGTVAEPTIIMGARVEFDRRAAPMAGTHITPDGGAQQPVRQLFTGLDQNPAKLTTDGSWQFPLRTSNTDPEVFTVTARTTACHCFWHIVLSVVLPDNQAKDIVVNDNGKPFEITSSSAATDKTYLPHDVADPWPRLTQ